MGMVGGCKELVVGVWAWVVVELSDEHWLKEFLPGCREVQSTRWVKLELWLLVSQGIHVG